MCFQRGLICQVPFHMFYRKPISSFQATVFYCFNFRGKSIWITINPILPAFFGALNYAPSPKNTHTHTQVLTCWRGGGLKIELGHHILSRLTPCKRIRNLWMPRTQTQTNTHFLVVGILFNPVRNGNSYEDVRRGTCLSAPQKQLPTA